MKFSGLLKANFLGPGPYEKNIKYRWELNAPLSFTFPTTDEEYELLKELGLTKTKSLRRVKKTGMTTLTCHAGFITDLASIPRSAWFIISPWDIARAAVIHDLLYQTLRKIGKSNLDNFYHTKDLADRIFKMAMETAEPKLPNWKIKVCYQSVKMFGKYTFD